MVQAFAQAAHILSCAANANSRADVASRAPLLWVKRQHRILDREPDTPSPAGVRSALVAAADVAEPGGPLPIRETDRALFRVRFRLPPRPRGTQWPRFSPWSGTPFPHSAAAETPGSEGRASGRRSAPGRLEASVRPHPLVGVRRLAKGPRRGRRGPPARDSALLPGVPALA